jgi:isocitrate dehydrogenase (NAD+)
MLIANMKHRITLIPGDGIGPEISEAATRVIEASGANVEWQWMEAGAEVISKYGSPMPDHVLNSIRSNKVALKGPITTPIGTGFSSPNVALRKALDLYACVRPTRSVPGVKSRYDNIDIVVIRENTEDLYSGIEHLVVPGVVESLKIITERASTRISEFTFNYAMREGRKKVTAVHKANIMKMSDGLFLECVRKVARRYPAIEYNELIVDNVCMQLVMNPHQFDVLLMENLYGDIISDLSSGLVGGVGVVAGANVGEDAAVFEAVHGSAPDIAGKNLANPTALILSGVMMLKHIGEVEAAGRIEKAASEVLRKGSKVTRDLGGGATTQEMASAIIAEMK